VLLPDLRNPHRNPLGVSFRTFTSKVMVEFVLNSRDGIQYNVSI
jgi:hypothetical protein